MEEFFRSLSKSTSHTSLIKPASTASETYFTAHPNAILEGRLDYSLTAWDKEDETDNASFLHTSRVCVMLDIIVWRLCC